MTESALAPSRVEKNVICAIHWSPKTRWFRYARSRYTRDDSTRLSVISDEIYVVINKCKLKRNKNSWICKMFGAASEISGVSQKIRSAIKTKLSELGVCVEDELPDYIMVMIANKKNRQQMSEDLNLFLGNTTDSFTSWLDDLLQRLQSVSSDKASNSANEHKVTEQKEQTKVTTSIWEEKADDVDKVKSSSKPEKVRIEPPKPKKLVDRPREIRSTVTTAKTDHEDILALKADNEDDFAEELKLESCVVKHKSSTSESAQLPKKQSSATRRRIVRVQPATQSIERKKGPVSTVSAVVHREEIAEQEYDPTNPSVGKVASVVKVSERKSSVPLSRQASKSLLMKAMKEAQDSVIKKSNVNKGSEFVAHVEPFSSSNSVNLFTKRYREQMLQQKSRIQVSDQQQQSVKPMIIDPVEEVIFTDKRDADISDRFMDDVVDEAIVLQSPPANIPFKIEESNTAPDITIDPSFVITLNGIDPASFAENRKCRERRVITATKRKAVISSDNDHLEYADEKYDDDDDEVGMDIDEDEYETIDKKMKLPERCKFWPACSNGSDCSYHHPSVPCKLFPKCKYGDKCHYIHPNCKFDSKCTKNDCPFTHASKRSSVVGSNSNVSSIKTLTAISSSLSSSSETICKFYPNCTNMNCQYKHMTECRWGFSCKRPGCQFSHPSLPTVDKLKWIANSESHSTNKSTA